MIRRQGNHMHKKSCNYYFAYTAPARPQAEATAPPAAEERMGFFDEMLRRLAHDED